MTRFGRTLLFAETHFLNVSLKLFLQNIFGKGKLFPVDTGFVFYFQQSKAY